MPAFQDPEIYREILDSLQIGISVTDLQKKIVFWSDGAERITGYSQIDVLGHSCADNILPHCNQDRCEMCSEECPHIMALREGRPREFAGLIHHKAGHQTPVHAWEIPLRNQHGSIIGVIHTFESEITLNGPDPSDRGIKERGCLDAVTNLPNRPMMRSYMRETLAMFAEFNIPFGVVCLDFHELEQVRARYSQAAATTLLQVLARTLRNAVWATDFVGRWSENRFLVILSGCGDEAVQRVAGRIQRMMNRAFIVWWGEELTVMISTGYTGVISGDSVESILQRAQQALGAKQVLQERSALAVAAAAKSFTT